MKIVGTRAVRLTLFLLICVTATYSQTLEKQLWGTASGGGVMNLGVIYKTNISGTDYAVQKVFTDAVNDGHFPTGTLVLASNGKLYGMTAYGGENNAGVIFEIDPANRAFRKLFDFSEATGGRPISSLAEGANHKLYGLASTGGSAGYGTLFEFDPEHGVFQKKIDFDETTGTSPNGPLVLAENNKLYGVTAGGGEYNEGVIFEYDPADGSYVVRTDLYLGSTGITTFAGLTIATNGKMYGLSVTGGDHGDGMIFEFDPTSGSFSKKFHFDENTTGANSRSNLMQASNGKLYGMTFSGGQASQGTLFEYDLTNGVFQKKVDFWGSSNGGSPFNDLIELPDGTLFGATTNGGINGSGILFSYNVSDGILEKRFDLVRATGSQPLGALILIDNIKAERQAQTIAFEPLSDRELTDQSFTLSASTTSGLPVTFVSSNTAVATVAGSTVTIVGAGTTEIKASQVGNDQYLPAEDVVRSFTVKLVTAIEVSSLKSISIYPNPTEGQIKLGGELQRDNLMLRIKDLLGREIMSRSLQRDTPTVDLATLLPGLYVLQVLSANSILYQGRLVKQ